LRFFLSCIVLIVLVLACGCDDGRREHASIMTGGGDPDRGMQAIGHYGCSSCHTIPGVRGADALVGPPLDRVGGRGYIGGVLQNTPDNMMRWIENPPGVDPMTAMPNMHVSEADARDIASYLYTLD
jgi:cytochrome c1